MALIAQQRKPTMNHELSSIQLVKLISSMMGTDGASMDRKWSKETQTQGMQCVLPAAIVSLLVAG